VLTARPTHWLLLWMSVRKGSVKRALRASIVRRGSPTWCAAAQTYTPTSGDAGHTIRVVETASNAGGSGSRDGL
jgi:hypothetical protein